MWISSDIISRARPTYQARKPCITHSDLPILLTESLLHWNPFHLCLSNCWAHWRHLCLPFRQSHLLCPKQSLRHRGTLPWNHPVYPKMENKWHCSTPLQLYPAQNWVGCRRSEESWCCKGPSIFFIHAQGDIWMCTHSQILQEFHRSWPRQQLVDLWTRLWSQWIQDHVCHACWFHHPCRASTTHFQERSCYPKRDWLH